MTTILQAKYSLGRLLGRGCAGSVYEITRIEDGKSFAMKVSFAKDMDDTMIRQACREALVMKKIFMSDDGVGETPFPWIVGIEDFWVDEVSSGAEFNTDGITVNVVMDLVDGPSLEAYIEKLKNPRIKRRSTGGFSRRRPGEELSESDEGVVAIKPDLVYSWIAQIILALQTLHSLRIIHRDIKPGNLLLSVDFKRIKLADFSISRILTEEEPVLETCAGTINYCAPEVLQGRQYGEHCDLWSLGCVLYEMLTLQKAFKVANTSKILSMVSRREIPTVPDDYDAGLAMLCNRLLNPDPMKRPTAGSLCGHPRLKPFIVQELLAIRPVELREKLMNFLDINSLALSISALTDLRETRADSFYGDQDPLVIIDESGDTKNGKLDDQFDEEIGCEVVPLLQGVWILSESSPQVEVHIDGRVVDFSDGRQKLDICRASRRSTPDAIEWLLGRDIILVKSLSSFITPQRIFFARLSSDKQQRGSGLSDLCLVLVREPSATTYHSAASTRSELEIH